MEPDGRTVVYGRSEKKTYTANSARSTCQDRPMTRDALGKKPKSRACIPDAPNGAASYATDRPSQDRGRAAGPGTASQRPHPGPGKDRRESPSCGPWRRGGCSTRSNGTLRKAGRRGAWPTATPRNQTHRRRQLDVAQNHPLWIGEGEQEQEAPSRTRRDCPLSSCPGRSGARSRYRERRRRGGSVGDDPPLEVGQGDGRQHRQEDEVDCDSGRRVVAMDEHGEWRKRNFYEGELGQRVARGDELPAAASH